MGRTKHPERKLGLGRLLLWQTSSVSVAISTLVIGFVTFYYTDMLGLEPVMVGTVLMLSKLVDGVTDFVAGVMVSWIPAAFWQTIYYLHMAGICDIVALAI